MNARFGILAATVLATTVFAANIAAQDVAPGEPFVDTIDVDIVNVEVVVTRDGQPVHGLTRDDFEIFDDGQPVGITNFYTIEDSRRIETAPAAGAPAAGALEATPRIRPEAASVVILVDNTFLGPASRRKISGALADHLDEILVDGAWVMVATKAREVHIEQSFTRDRAEIDAALGRILTSSDASGFVDAQRSFLVRAIDIGDDPSTEAGAGEARDLFSRITGYADQVRADVSRSTAVLRAFLNALSGVPGRKALIYLSDQLPLHPGDDVFAVWLSKYGGYARATGITSMQDFAIEYDTTAELLELAADAASSRVAFYPVGGDTSFSRYTVSARASGHALTPIRGDGPSMKRGLQLLARTTGGDTAFGVANVRAFAEDLRRDVSNYYSLGYPSPHSGDGGRHRVQVKVKGSGLAVRYLDTYRDKSTDQHMTDLTLAALFFEQKTSSNPLNVRLRVGEPEPKSNFFMVPLEVFFPLANVTLVPREGHHVGNVSIFVVARDARGRTTDPVRIRVPVRVPGDQVPLPENQLAGYKTKLAMRPGEQTVAVGVRDDVGAVSSTVRVVVDVGANLSQINR